MLSLQIEFPGKQAFIGSVAHKFTGIDFNMCGGVKKMRFGTERGLAVIQSQQGLQQILWRALKLGKPSRVVSI